ncbi:hypothetical protein PBV87_19805 [Niameybacter massiliensis]|uniref:Uncharacterized protein n=1 Tax=Holtiella tumoricola TaxID=3018743 RepID=A0AA42DR70_9FIRM|nr:MULTISPECIES: hypothetical protein [Lachnospirales]MDA3733720.1 hypothetical protein [Holtiella tumoricola]
MELLPLVEDLILIGLLTITLKIIGIIAVILLILLVIRFIQRHDHYKD